MTDENPEKHINTNYKTEPDSLWEDYQKIRKFNSLEPFQYSPFVLETSSIRDVNSIPNFFEKDIWFKMLVYGFAMFFLMAMLVFGGRDLFLLGFGQNSIASRLPVQTYSCGKACYKITYQFTIDNRLYYATGRTTYNYNNPQTVTVSYLPWYPSINKIKDDIFYSKP